MHSASQVHMKNMSKHILLQQDVWVPAMSSILWRALSLAAAATWFEDQARAQLSFTPRGRSPRT